MMKISALTLTAILVASCAYAPPIQAADISTHVLDLNSGVGGDNVPVTLIMKTENGAWKALAKAKTDKNGLDFARLASRFRAHYDFR